MMRKTKVMIASLVAINLLAMILTACGKEESSIPNPDEYITLGQYKGLEYDMTPTQITEDDIEEEMNFLASSYATSEVLTEGEVKEGDVANIDFEGKLDGVAFDGGTSKGYDLTIGSHSFIDGFEEGLVGVSIGDTVDLNLTFPENYGAANLAGKDVVFTVTVNSVKRDVLPEINDDFIKEISKNQYKTVEEYKIALQKQMAEDDAKNSELRALSELLKMAVANAKVNKDIPNAYIQSKVNRMLINVQDYAKTYNMDVDSFLEQYMGLSRSEYNAQSIEYAKEAAKQSLVIWAIAQKEDLLVTDEELNKAINEYIEQYGYKDEEDFRSKTDMNDFTEYILTSKVEDFLYENAKLIK